MPCVGPLGNGEPDQGKRYVLGIVPAGERTRRPPLAPGEARALAAELAPAHDPNWLWRRFEAHRRRRGVELRDERRAFAGFAGKCQRDRAGGGPWA